MPEVPAHPVPYWKQAHRDWRFILAVGVMLVAITTYVATDDLALRPAEPGITAN